MTIFNRIYLKIINEWHITGQQSLFNFPKSYNLGLFNFKISNGHCNQRDFERAITFTIGEKTTYEILDEACAKILTNYKHILKNATSKNLVRFNVIVKVNPDNYFNFVIAFKNKHSAELFTTIDITKRKYEYFKTLASRTDSNGNLNYIITLRDF